MSVTKGVHGVRAHLAGLLDTGGRALLGERGRRRRLVVAILGLLVLSKLGSHAVFRPPRLYEVAGQIAPESWCGMPVIAPDAPIAPMPVIGADPTRSFSIRVSPPDCHSWVAGGTSEGPRSRKP